MTKKSVAFCFDIDGVLADTENRQTRKKIATAEKFGIELTEKDLPNLEGISVPAVWKWLTDSKELEVDKETFAEEGVKLYLADPEEIKARDGALEAVSYLHRLEVPMCAVSSGEEEEVVANLEGSGFKDYMQFFISSKDVQNTKPHPEPYLKGISKLCEELGLDVDTIEKINFVAVEDTPTGITSAKAASMTAVFWPENPEIKCPEADYTARSAFELLNIFQTITAENIQTLLATNVPVRRNDRFVM